MSGCSHTTAARSGFFNSCPWTRALAALVAGAMGGAAMADGPAAPERMMVPHRIDFQRDLSPFVTPPSSSLPGPFTPRGSTVLYSRTVQVATLGYTFGGTPDGAGTQVDSWFDDISIPAAGLQVAGVTSPLLSICQIQLAARMGPNAPANSMNVYWTTLDETNTASGITFPPTLIANIPVPANNTGANATLVLTIGDGVNPIAGLEAVPLDMGFITQGGQPGVFGSFAIGQSIGTLNASVVGHRICTATAPNINAQSFDLFWEYDSDPNPQGAGPYGFGNPNGSFYYVIKGTPVAPTTPIACCMPGTTSAVCFVAANQDNCTKSGGNTVAGQTTCTASSCTIINCCNLSTGACTAVAGQPNCPGAQVLTGAACAPNPCAQPNPPANDECFGAFVGSPYELTIPANPTLTDQTTAGWTVSAGYDAAPGIANCTFAQKDVWYLFTATPAQATQQLQVTVTPNPASGDFTPQPLAIAVYDGGPGCPAGPGSEIACEDFANPNHAIFTGNGSLAYYFRVAFGGAATPGTTLFSINVASVVSGACCNQTNGLCVLSDTIGQCTTLPGYTVYQGDNTTCTTAPCPQGSCCATSGACAITGPSGCAPTDFTLSGSCAPNPCSGACCNPNTFACTITGESGCIGGGGAYAGGGSVCTTQGICPAPPNDQCSAAFALALGTATNGTINSATGTDLTSCSTSAIDVWYTFTPATTGNYSIKTTPATPNDVGTAVAFFTGACDPVADSDIDCAPQVIPGATNELLDTLIAGTPILIRVAAFPGDTGNFSILVSQPTGLGACCDIGAFCLIVADAADCPAPAVYRGVDSTCAAPATQCPAGSCCFPGSGQCFVTIQSFCTGVTGVWNAGDQTCGTTNCIIQAPPNDDCTTARVVTSPTFTHHVGTDGAAAEGAPISACNDATAFADQNSVWYTFTAPAAGVLNIKVNNYGTYDMLMGVYTGACTALTEIGCLDDPEPYDINVNMPAAGNVKFEIAQWGLTSGGGWLSVNTTFSTTGQCCISGACTVTTQALCTGTWTDGGTCTVNTCPPPAGICCRGATCNAAVTQANCTTTGVLAGAFYQTASGTCTGTTIAGCCHADYNKINGIEIQDIFDYINDWLAGSIFANTGGDGTPGPLAVQNIFDFINDWLAGCP